MFGSDKEQERVFETRKTVQKAPEKYIYIYIYIFSLKQRPFAFSVSLMEKTTGRLVRIYNREGVCILFLFYFL